MTIISDIFQTTKTLFKYIFEYISEYTFEYIFEYIFELPFKFQKSYNFQKGMWVSILELLSRV